MERKRIFWKMRGHVGFDEILCKIQRVRVFFCHCWVKLKPFPLSLPFFLGEEKQEYLTLTKASFGELPKPGQELSPMVTAEPVEFLIDVSTCTCGKGETGTEGKWSRSPGRGRLWYGCAAEQGGDESSVHASEPSLFSFQVSLCPLRSRGSGMLWLLTLVCLCSFGRDVSRAAWAAYGKGNGSQGYN